MVKDKAMTERESLYRTFGSASFVGKWDVADTKQVTAKTTGRRATMFMHWSWKPRGFGTTWATAMCTASSRARPTESWWKCHRQPLPHLEGTFPMLVLGEPCCPFLQAENR